MCPKSSHGHILYVVQSRHNSTHSLQIRNVLLFPRVLVLVPRRHFFHFLAQSIHYCFTNSNESQDHRSVLTLSCIWFVPYSVICLVCHYVRISEFIKFVGQRLEWATFAPNWPPFRPFCISILHEQQRQRRRRRVRMFSLCLRGVCHLESGGHKRWRDERHIICILEPRPNSNLESKGTLHLNEPFSHSPPALFLLRPALSSQPSFLDTVWCSEWRNNLQRET